MVKLAGSGQQGLGGLDSPGQRGHWRSWEDQRLTGCGDVYNVGAPPEKAR